MANCMKCGQNSDIPEVILYVMEWSDNLVGNRQVQQAQIRGAVKAILCPSCRATFVAGRTKGMLIPKKEKEAAKTALDTGNFAAFIEEAAANAVKELINAPNAGKSKVMTAWAQVNAADHLVNATCIPAELVAVCLIEDNGEAGFVEHEPIRYILTRPSVFKFITYNQRSDKFDFVNGERWIAPKWLAASENTLMACRKFLTH